jgi:hypothetical protein
MKILTTALFLVGLRGLGWGQAIDAEEEGKLVNQCFKDYKQAVLKKDYPKAIKLLDSNTLAYYKQILSWVKYGDASEVDSLNIFDKLTVLLIRQEAQTEALLTYQPKELITFCYTKGLLGGSNLKNTSLGETIMDKNNAQARLMVDGFKTTGFYQFYKSNDGQWKIDISSIFPQSAGAFQQMAKRKKVDENTYIFALIEAKTGKRPTKEIWQPVIGSSTR